MTYLAQHGSYGRTVQLPSVCLWVYQDCPETRHLRIALDLTWVLRLYCGCLVVFASTLYEIREVQVRGDSWFAYTPWS